VPMGTVPSHLNSREEGSNSCPEAHCPMVRWPCAGGALYGLPAARAEAGRLPLLARKNDYFFCSVVVVPWRAFRRSSRPVRRS
jgi:hypothetical protein